MRGRTKLVSLATMLAVLLTVSMVFASGFVDVSTVQLFSEPPVTPSSPANDLAVSPVKIIKDYLNDPDYQIGNTFELYIDIASAVDVFSYQVNVTWNPSMLNFTGITYGDFLATTASPYGTSSIEDIYMASNETGYAAIAETILGDVAGITGSGRLFTMQFEIVGYGATPITISSAGALPTMLLDSAGTSVTFTTAYGYFRNVLFGDATLNGIVDSADISRIIYHRSGPPAGPGGYNREADLNDNTVIDSADISIVIANRGRSVSIP